MKKLNIRNMISILGLLMVIFGNELRAQDGDPPPIYAPNAPEFAQTPDPGFQLGWNWGQSVQPLNDEFRTNVFHQVDYSAINGNDPDWELETGAKDASYLYYIHPRFPARPLNHEGHTQNIETINLLYGVAMQFDPELSASQDGFEIRDNDESPAAFGFNYRHSDGITESNPQSELYHHFELRADQVLDENSNTANQTNGIEVLSGNFPDDEIFRTHVVEANATVADRDRLAGRNWFLSVKLRRSEEEPGPFNATDNVLRIQLQYTTNDRTSGYIEFSHLPFLDPNATVPNHYPGVANSRGQRVQPNPAASNEMFITKEMLPNGQNPEEITVSRFFRLGESTNPLLRLGRSTAVAGEIRNFNIIVTYYGGTNVAIDWIRIEAPNARNLFWGDADADVSTVWRNRLRDFPHTGYTLPDGSIGETHVHRFFGLDEPEPSQYLAQRYINQLTGGRAVTELNTSKIVNAGTNTNVIRQVNHYYNEYIQICQPSEFWSGQTLRFYHSAAAPYIPNGFYHPGGPFTGNQATDDQNRQQDYLNFYGGYQMGWDENDPVQAIDYEASVLGYNGTLPLTGQQNIETLDNGWLSNAVGLQLHIERQLVDYYINTPDYLFDEVPWISNIWLASEWETEPNYWLENSRTRPLTSEELRLLCWYPTLLGAKGLIYWFPETSETVNGADFRSVGPHNRVDDTTAFDPDPHPAPDPLHDEDFLLTQDHILGGDFLVPLDESGLFEDIPLVDVAGNLGIRHNDGTVNTDRIYMGRTSQRLELRDIHTVIDENRETIENLELVAWYDKGFREYELADENGFTQLSDRVNISDLKKRVRIINESNNLENEHHTFFGVMLLRDTRLSNMDDVYYIGIINRRTDPTLDGTRPEYIGVGHEVAPGRRFVTGAEFRDIIDQSTDPMVEYHQAGSREYELEFLRPKPTVVGYAISEVGVTGQPEEIGHSENFTTRLRPGEGKLFRVQVRHSGHLSNSNQRKMIRFTDPNTGNLVYARVFHRIEGDGSMDVYYQLGSADPNVLPDNRVVTWEDEVLISQDAVELGGLFTNTITTAGYPAIVVRDEVDGAVPEAIVVYAAEINGQSFIVENRFPFDTPSTLGQALISYSGQVSEDAGTPMICAGPRGNYYTWSDDNGGIGVAFKYLLSGSFDVVPQYLSFTTPHSPGLARHPSLNSYSRPFSGQDCDLSSVCEADETASLVWSESGQVYYTRLRLQQQLFPPSLTIENFLPDLNGYIMPTLNAASTIAQFSESICSDLNDFPVVHRSSERFVESVGCGFSQHTHNLERIYWEGSFLETTGASQYRIFERDIDIDISYPTPGGLVINFSELEWLATLNSNFLRFPSLAPGQADDINCNENHSERAYALSFTETKFLDVKRDQSSLWVAPRSYWGLPFVSEVNQRAYELTSRPGAYSQLSGASSVTAADEYYDNAITFEEGFGPTVDFSREAFSTLHPNSGYNSWYGFNADCSIRYGTSIPQLDGIEIPFAAVKSTADILETVLKNGIPITRYKEPTKVTSDPFVVGASNLFEINVMGADPAIVNLDIVRLSTGARTNIPLPTTISETPEILMVNLLNGGGEAFQLEYYPTIPSSRLVRDTYIGGSANPGAFSVVPLLRQGAGLNLDLDSDPQINHSAPTLNLAPNPADKTLELLLRVPQSASKKYDVRIVNALGQSALQLQVEANAARRVDVAALPTGVYQVQTVVNSGAGDVPVTAKLVINR